MILNGGFFILFLSYIKFNFIFIGSVLILNTKFLQHYCACMFMFQTWNPDQIKVFYEKKTKSLTNIHKN